MLEHRYQWDQSNIKKKMKTKTRMAFIAVAVLWSLALCSQTENPAVVAADKLNLLYVGIDNPVSVAVPGVTSDKIKVSVSNGSIRGNNGNYIVKVKEGDETMIDVTAEVKPGEVKKVGSVKFRIANLPDPVVCIDKNKIWEVNFTKEELVKIGEINVSNNGPFDLQYKISGYTFVTDVKGELITIKAEGNKFSKEILDFINRSAPNSRVWIEQVVITGPGGTRNIQGIGIKLIERK